MLNSFGRYRVFLGFLVALTATNLLSSCETDLKKIQEILDGDSGKAGTNTVDVDVIYSDSGFVKARLTAPLMVSYDDTTSSYKEMPKGVHIIFYDKKLNVTTTIDAKYGRVNQATDVYELRKNVVVTNEQGDTFTSEELTLDHRAHKLYSTVPSQMMSKDGDVMNGNDFESDEEMTHYTMNQTTGIIKVDEKEME